MIRAHRFIKEVLVHSALGVEMDFDHLKVQVYRFNVLDRLYLIFWTAFTTKQMRRQDVKEAWAYLTHPKEFLDEIFCDDPVDNCDE